MCYYPSSDGFVQMVQAYFDNAYAITSPETFR